MSQRQTISAEQPARRLVGAFALLTVATLAYGVWHDYSAASSRVASLADQMVRAVESQASRSLDFRRAMVDHIVTEIGPRGIAGMTETDRQGIREEMAMFAASLGDRSPVWVVDAEGRVVVSNAEPDGPAGVSDNEGFRAVRDGASLHVGGPAPGAQQGRRMFPLARRVEDGAGAFVGAVITAVSADHFEDAFGALGLEAGTAASLIDARTDEVLVRYPASSSTVGAKRVSANRRLADYPVIARIDIARQPLFAQWTKPQTWAVMIASVLAGVVLLLGRRVIDATRATDAANEKLKVALSDRTLLLADVHHRVKNNLQIIQSLLTMEALTAAPDARHGYHDSLRRIQAMGMVHELLYQSGEFGSIRCKEYLTRLCELLVGDHPSVALAIEGDEVELDVDRAVPFAMAVTEIVSNALKHGFPGGRQGRLVVGMRLRGGHLTVAVSDDGIGLPPGFQPGKSNSLGTRLLLGLAAQLGGDVVFESAVGTTVRLSFPHG